MSQGRLFLDTAFVQALYNSRDQYQDAALALLPQTDCISVVVMQQQNLLEAATADLHFVQAGYRALLLSDR